MWFVLWIELEDELDRCTPELFIHLTNAIESSRTAGKVFMVSAQTFVKLAIFFKLLFYLNFMNPSEISVALVKSRLDPPTTNVKNSQSH